MALIRIDADGRHPAAHGTDADLASLLRAALPSEGPITLMVHGYKFRPGHPLHCPHNHIFAPQDGPRPKAVSWPLRLGHLGNTSNSGLGIAFGWHARGSLKQALRSALRASHALSRLVQILRDLAPDRPVNLICHSMGAYVSLNALHRLSPGDIGRIIALNGAVFRPKAAAALRTPAGRTAELFNVASSENAFYDILFEHLLGRAGAHDRSVGRGFDAPNALTIQLDDRACLKRLSALGHHIAPPTRWLCHWSPYLRPGAMAFYNALLRHPADLPLATLQTQLTPRSYLASLRAPRVDRSCGTV